MHFPIFGSHFGKETRWVGSFVSAAPIFWVLLDPVLGPIRPRFGPYGVVLLLGSHHDDRPTHLNLPNHKDDDPNYGL